MNILALLKASRVGSALLWILGIVLAAGAIVLRLLSAGRAQERARQDAQSLDNLRSRQETDRDVANLDDARLRGRLGRWVRDDAKGR